MSTNTTNEKQTCPRRTGELGPWKRDEGLDEWERDRWCATAEESAAKSAEWNAEHPDNGWQMPDDHMLWKGEPWMMPRTCSFCGSVHPDDAILLMSNGWEVEATGKSYKRYLNPPGTAQRLATLMRRLDAREPEPFRAVPSVWSPTPPVKLYTMHMSEAQVGVFNAALRAIFGES